MAPIADRWPEERIFYRSDHYHFARAGRPDPLLHQRHPPRLSSAHRSPGPGGRGEGLARRSRLLFYVGAAVADEPERPRWLPGELPAASSRRRDRISLLDRIDRMRRTVARSRWLSLVAHTAAQTAAPVAARRPRSPSADVAHRIGIIAHDSHDGPRHAEPGTRPDRPVHRRPVPAGSGSSRAARTAPGSSATPSPGGSSTSPSRGSSSRPAAPTAIARFDRSARYSKGAVPDRPVTGPAVLVGGTPDGRTR